MQTDEIVAILFNNFEILIMINIGDKNGRKMFSSTKNTPMIEVRLACVGQSCDKWSKFPRIVSIRLNFDINTNSIDKLDGALLRWG